MTDTLFEVVFQGKLVDGFSAADVKANVARLFKASPQQVEQMFSGKRVVIRNQLDQETALKYQVLLRKNGAVSVVETMKPATGASAPASSPAQTAPQNSPATAPAATQTAAQPNPFPNTPRTPSVPASESGRLQVAGKRVDSILSGLDLTLDPVGVTLAPRSSAAPPQAPDINHLSLAPVGAKLSANREVPPPIVPDVDHLSVAPPGTRLSDPDPDE